MLYDKKQIIQEINALIASGVVKNVAQICRDLDYSRGAVSQMLNLSSDKPISETFVLKLRNKYRKPELPQENDLKRTVDVLIDMVAQLVSQQSGRLISLVKADIQEAIKKTTD